MSDKTPLIYSALVAAAKDLAAGVPKARENVQQHYMFRGIDDVMAAAGPALAAHGIVLLPQYHDREMIERESRGGGALYYVTLRATYTFVSAEDGSHVAVSTYGEAMDSADKATNKAMSAALKYALMQALMIPVAAEDDADAVTPEPLPGRAARAATARPAQAAGGSGIEKLGDGWIRFPTAKFPTDCANCGGRIEAGDPVEWNGVKGGGAQNRHPECPTVGAAQPELPQHIADAANWTPGEDDISF